MKGSQKGFILPLLLVIGLIVIAGGIYFVMHQSAAPIVQNSPDNSATRSQPPRITEISPEVPVGALLLIFGYGFGGLENTVTFGNLNVSNQRGETIQRCTSGGKDCTTTELIDRITIPVPDLPPGTYNLSVTNVNGTSNSMELKVIAPVSPPPFSPSPSSSPVR